MIIEEITTPPTIEQQLLNCYRQNQWRRLDLDEGQYSTVEFLDSPMFERTFKQKAEGNPRLEKKVEDFKRFKLQNPLQNFGGSDYPFVSAGPLGNAVPGKIGRAHV